MITYRSSLATSRSLIVGLLIALVAPAAVAQARPSRPDRPARPDRQMRAVVGAPVIQNGGWIGITVEAVDKANLLKGPVVVREVYPDSPADEAGIQVGDTIIRWNDKEDVRGTIRSGPAPDAGDTVRLRVRRGGERDRDLTLVAAERPGTVRIVRVPGGPDQTIIIPELDEVISDSVRIQLRRVAVQMDSVHRHLREVLGDSLQEHFRNADRELRVAQEQIRLMEPELRAQLQALRAEAGAPTVLVTGFGGRSVAGAEFSEINEGLASYFGTDRGVLVLKVAPETPADRAGLKAGDVIVEADGMRINDIGDLRRSITRSTSGASKLEILRDKKRQTLQLRWGR